MKRPGLGLAALAVAAAVLFAPRPWMVDATSSPSDPAGPLVGRILSPAISSGEIREQRNEKAIKDAGSVVWWAGTAIASALAISRKRSLEIDPPRQLRSFRVLDPRFSRAPPLSVPI